MPKGNKIVKEWFERGEHDLKGAEILFKSGHYPDTIAILIHQATEKYLKGFLISNGWYLKKIHDLEKLVTETMTFAPAFEHYLDFARRVTAYYVEERYPPGPAIDYPREEMKESLATAKEMIEKIKNIVKYD